MLQPLNQWHRLAPLAIAQPHHMHFVTAVGALRGRDHHPAAIVRYRRTVAQLGPIGRGIDQLVGRLRRADTVEVDRLIGVERLEFHPFGRLREARIEKSGIADPRDAGELGPADLVRQHLAGGHIEQADGPPVRTAILDRIGQQLAIVRRLPVGQRGRTVLGPAIRVDQQARGPGQGIADKQLRLVLQARIAHVEIVGAGLARQAEPFVIHQRLDPLGKPIPLRQRAEILLGHRVLLLHPGRDRRIGPDIVLQPTIGIGDRLAERRLDNRATSGLRIGQFVILSGNGDSRHGKQGTDHGAGATRHDNPPPNAKSGSKPSACPRLCHQPFDERLLPIRPALLRR